MVRIAYVDAFSGASGDMLMGALLDAGLPFEDLRAALARLGLEGYELRAEPRLSHGLTGTKFDVIDTAAEHPARTLSAVRRVIEGSGLSALVMEQSLRVFHALAEAEAAVHGVDLEDVHFHEIGAVDTLVDIVGFCWALDAMGIEKVYCSPLPVGSGTIRTAHGLLPVPAPATLELLAKGRALVAPSEAQAELLTPTGAAILITLAAFERPALRVAQVGYGFGTRELPWANMLRIWLGDMAAAPAADPGPGAHGHDHANAGTDQHTHTHDGADEHGHSHDHPHGDHTH